MKTNNSKLKINSSRPKSKLILVACLVVAIALTVGWYFYTNRNKSENNNGQQDSAQTDTAKNLVENESDTTDPKQNDNSENVDAPIISPQDQQNPRIEITNYSQANGLVAISSNLINSAGATACVFNFSTPDERPVVRQSKPSNSACNAEIPSVEFTKLGIWQLSVVAYNGDKEIARESQSVTIN